jgi:hypothetical protein
MRAILVDRIELEGAIYTMGSGFGIDALYG